MNRKLVISFILLFISSFFMGCLATKQDVINMRLEVRELRKEVTEGMENNVAVNIEIRDEIISEIDRLKKINADLRFNIDAQSDYIRQISGKVDQNKYRFDDLETRKDSLETIYKKLSLIEDKLFKLWISTSPVAAALPEDIYDMARGDYTRGNYDLALIGFKKLIDEYPDTITAKRAQYDMAVTYYAKKDWAKTCEEIDIFTGIYPDHELVPKAFILKAKALRKLGDFVAAKKIYNKIIKKYPASEEAKIAKDELDRFEM